MPSVLIMTSSPIKCTVQGGGQMLGRDRCSDVNPTFFLSSSTRVHTRASFECGDVTEELWLCRRSHSTKSFKTPFTRHKPTTTKSSVDHTAMVPWKGRHIRTTVCSKTFLRVVRLKHRDSHMQRNILPLVIVHHICTHKVLPFWNTTQISALLMHWSVHCAFLTLQHMHL